MHTLASPWLRTGTGLLRPWLILASLLVSSLFMGCEEASDFATEEEFVYNNTIFQGVSYLDAAQSGDRSRPNFSWPATEQKHVACGIFARRISVRQNLISNTNDLVWIWHSGLGRGRDGNILFEHGAANESGAEPPRLLTPHTYYWAVWALSEEGLPVAATTERELTVP